MPTQPSLFSVFVRNGAIIIVIVLAATLAGLYASRQKKEQVFTGSLGMTVQLSKAVPEAQAAVVISNSAADVTQGAATVQTWLREPAFAADVLKKGGKDVNSMAVEELALAFEVVPGAANSASFHVQVQDSKQEKVESVLTALAERMDSRATAYNAVTPQAPALLIDSGTPVIAEDKQDGLTTVLAAFAAGCVIAILLVAALERKRIS